MFYDHGCHGELELGALPTEVQERLIREPGEWLEYEVASNRIVVRHVQPTSGPDLPIVVGELVQLLSMIPAELHSEIVGGDFFVHTEDTGQLVRIHVARGGAVDIRWAHPDFAHAAKREYGGRNEISIDPHVHRLDGTVEFTATDARAAASALQSLADSFEGLYPQGTCEISAEGGSAVRLQMKDLNLDAHLLVEALKKAAESGSLSGRIVVTSFGEAQPEDHTRIVFEAGRALVQHAMLWPDVPA